MGSVQSSHQGPAGLHPVSRIYVCKFSVRNVRSSGEFHTFRLPVPDLWLDILQKIKAAGFNAISVYTHMGLINPSPGVIDFNDYRALRPLFEVAKQVGVWIVLRPGALCATERTSMNPFIIIRTLHKC